MSDTTGSAPEPIDARATEPLQLADQSPVPPVVQERPKTSHTRTILEVVGGVVAVVLIVAAAGVGFAVGHFTSDNGRADRAGRGFTMGGQGFGEGPGFGQGPGMMGGQGFGQGPGFGDPRGIDPDGDNWTGGGQGAGPDRVPASPAAPSAPATP